ncbi:1474_t:CDS:2 [Entrophospora sp. SA101]|nr:6075_t:CDS:2 [Entrophospora sp. SA101]CAJ0831695.1 1474_t:CDS:2 [Entrophospora sp. SA101]
MSLGCFRTKNYKVTCLTEQISHHPPVSAFCYHSEDKGITACGVDQLLARFTRTSSVQGWLKASPYVVVAGSCIITCQKTKLKAILEYKEEMVNENDVLAESLVVGVDKSMQQD